MVEVVAGVRADVEASREKAYAAERAVAGIRVLIIAFNSLAYAFLLDHAGTIPTLAYMVIATANIYGLVVYFAEPYRRFPVLMSSYFTTFLDAGFITVWLIATGGIASPFHVLWLVSVTATAFRFGYRETMFAAFVYAASYVGLVAAGGDLASAPGELTVRIAYIFFVAAVGGLLARESFDQTREKLALRRLATAFRESEERVRRLSDAAFEGIGIHENGKVLEANRAFARMFGYTHEEVIGMHALDFIAPESRELVARRIASPSDSSYEVIGLRKDGSTFPMETIARTTPYEGRTARVTAVRDITERKAAEAALVEKEALSAKNDRLQEIDRLKTHFINTAAHELATPLTPIKVQTHLLHVGSLGPLNERQQKAISVVSRNADQLGFLVRDVVDSARLQAGRLRVEPKETDLARLLQDAAESFADPARASRIELRVDAPVSLMVKADAARITQVVFNLVSNALKFTPADGRVHITARREDDNVVIEVSDSGDGLRAEDIPRLFLPFSQVNENVDLARRGTGLGLYISRGIVEAHGGRIWAASEGVGKGSTFAFSLPR